MNDTSIDYVDLTGDKNHKLAPRSGKHLGTETALITLQFLTDDWDRRPVLP